MSTWPLTDYELQRGGTVDRPQLLRFVHQTYAELYPDMPRSHLEPMVGQYLTTDTPLWWVVPSAILPTETTSPRPPAPSGLPQGGGTRRWRSPIAGLWVGTSRHQGSGAQQGYIFLLYVHPEHRRRGIGTALMRQAETWAQSAGYGQIALQVFTANRPAYHLYEMLGYQPESMLMVKDLNPDPTSEGAEFTT